MSTVVFRIPGTFPATVTPNSTAHYMQKYSAKRELKERTMLSMQAAETHALPPLPWRIDYIIAWEKGRKRMDDDNAKASLKAVQDGVADVAGINDKDIEQGTVEQSRDPHKAGYIEVMISHNGGEQ